MNTNEVWLSVKGYEGFYEISNLGRVRSIVKTIKSTKIKTGYCVVCLSKFNIPKRHSIHRLVAEAFIKPIPGKIFVNHKNGIKHDNRVENLEWCTHVENVRHAIALGLFNFGFCKKPIGQYKDGQLIQVYSSVSETENFGYCRRNVQRCALGRWTHYKGFQWVYQ